MKMQTDTHEPAGGREHQWAQRTLPWYVNRTLPDNDLERLQRHLEICARCRADLEQERRIAAHVAQDVVVPHTAQTGFARLQQRIDRASARRERLRALWSRVWPGGRADADGAARPWLAAGVAVQAAALLTFGALIGWLVVDASRTPQYQTLSSPDEQVPADHLQVVFAETVTTADKDRMLEEIDGRIVAGPLAAGVVLVALGPNAPDLDTAARQLSKRRGVVFVAAHRAVEQP